MFSRALSNFRRKFGSSVLKHATPLGRVERVTYQAIGPGIIVNKPRALSTRCLLYSSDGSMQQNFQLTLFHSYKRRLTTMQRQNHTVLTISNLSITYPQKNLFNEVSLSISKGDRIIMVGENGSGKSTLLKTIMGTVKGDTGFVKIAAGIQIAYLPQDPAGHFAEKNYSVLEYVSNFSKDKVLIEVTQNLINLRGSLLLRGIDPESADEFLDLFATFNAYGGYRQIKILQKLKLDNEIYKKCHLLSGGQKTRLILAGIALSEADLLLLDEPTNHLDFDALLWLEKYLTAFQGAAVIVSHDRQLINQVANSVVEIDPHTHKFNCFTGRYVDYLQQKERKYQNELQQYQANQTVMKELEQSLSRATVAISHTSRRRSDNDKLGYNARGGRKEKSTSRYINATQTKLEALSNRSIKPKTKISVAFEFSPVSMYPQIAFELTNISIRYDSQFSLTNINRTVLTGTRVVLIGPNGCGKSTLLKIIMGQVKQNSGVVHIGHGVKLGYLEQEYTLTDGNVTLLESYLQEIKPSTTEMAYQILVKSGLFEEPEINQPLGTLSGGQLRKFQFAKIIASQANVLILDEPTNHVDFRSLEQLEEALLKFSGTIIAASHDRYFIKKIATETWDLSNGVNYDEHLSTRQFKVK